MGSSASASVTTADRQHSLRTGRRQSPARGPPIACSRRRPRAPSPPPACVLSSASAPSERLALSPSTKPSPRTDHPPTLDIPAGSCPVECARSSNLRSHVRFFAASSFLRPADAPKPLLLRTRVSHIRRRSGKNKATDDPPARQKNGANSLATCLGRQDSNHLRPPAMPAPPHHDLRSLPCHLGPLV